MDYRHIAHAVSSYPEERSTGFSGLTLGTLGTSAALGAVAGYLWERQASASRRAGIAAGVGATAFALSITFSRGSLSTHLLNGAAAAIGTFGAGALLHGGHQLAARS
jgi:hypothetical protein